MIRLDRAEVAIVLAVVTHPAGFDVDLFGGMLCVRPTDQGVFCVSWDGTGKHESGERCFKDPLRAVASTSPNRRWIELGQGCDTCAREAICQFLALKITGRPWPTYGDDQASKDAFFVAYAKNARPLGYSLNKADEGDGTV